MKWPYLKESLCVGVSDQKCKYVVGPGQTTIAKPHDSAQWHADVTNGTNELMRTQGGIFAKHEKLLYCVRACEGLVEAPRWDVTKTVRENRSLVPMQLCLAAHPRDKSEAEAAKDLGVSEGDDMKVTWREGDEALFLGSLALRFLRQSSFERSKIWEFDCRR